MELMRQVASAVGGKSSDTAFLEFLTATAREGVVAAGFGMGVTEGYCWRSQGGHRNNRGGRLSLRPGKLSQIVLHHELTQRPLVARINPGLLSRHYESFGRPPTAFILGGGDDFVIQFGHGFGQIAGMAQQTFVRQKIEEGRKHRSDRLEKGELD